MATPRPGCDLSVVIVNYNVRDLLIDAVASVLQAFREVDGEIIVVDNASSDGAVEELRSRYPAVTVIPLERNIGFGGANNVGAAEATGRYILFLNPDTIVSEETFTTMIALMEGHPKAGAAGCRVLNADGRPDPAARRGFPSPWSAFCRITGLSRLFPNSRLFGRYNMTWADDGTTFRIEALTGAFMFFRREVFEEIGGFDTDFFMYGEDLDLCRRTIEAGYEIWYHPETHIVHLRGASTRRSSLDAIGMFYDAMEVFAEKHFRSKRLLMPMLRLGIVLRRGIARSAGRYPNIRFAIVDAVAVIAALCLSVVLRTGHLVFPPETLPWVFIAPPIGVILAQMMAGSYGPESTRFSRVLLGYLGGFFVLSALPYFFPEYRFSRGVVLATTGIASVLSIGARFLWILGRRTFGRESRRRVAIVGRGPIDAALRNRVRRLLLGPPATIVGSILPRFSDVDRSGSDGIGTLENIRNVVESHRLTDLVVVDASMGYGEVIGAMRRTSGGTVRFHLLRDHDMAPVESGGYERVSGREAEAYRPRLPLGKRLTDRLLALLLLTIRPLVSSLRAADAPSIGAYLSVLGGSRQLVDGAAPEEGGGPLYSAADLYADGSAERLLSVEEREEIRTGYRRERSLLLDCEIIIGTLRFVHPVAVEATGSSVARK